MGSLLRDAVLSDKLEADTQRLLGDTLFGSELLGLAVGSGLGDDTRVDPGQTAPTAIFENLVGDRAVFRAEASAVLWRVMALYRATKAVGRFAQSFASLRQAGDALGRMC